jgi:uncharacterized integral membrane protein
MEQLPETGTERKPAPRKRGQTAKLVATGLGGALVAAFAILNLDKVEVNWIVGEGRTPLIIVILISVLVGAALGFLIGRSRAKP